MESKKEILLVLGQNIQKAREKQNIDIKELANRIGYDRICLSRLEYGEQNVTYKTAMKLAKELNTSFPSLFSRNYLSENVEEFCEDDFLMVFIENIKHELKVKGITQTRIYIEYGVPESVISRVLSKKTDNPTLDTLYKIAMGATDIEMSKLFSRNITE